MSLTFLIYQPNLGVVGTIDQSLASGRGSWVQGVDRGCGCG